MLCWKAGLRPVTPIPWGWKPKGAGSICSCSASRPRSSIKALLDLRRSRTAPMVATQPASRSGIRPMTRARALWTKRTRRRTQRMAPGSSMASRRTSFAAASRLRAPSAATTTASSTVERARQPRRQTIGQQAEGRVALGAIPASDAHTLRRLALIGPVPCQRTAAVRMLRAPLKPCLAPCPGGNVLLAGKPRLDSEAAPAMARRGFSSRGPLSCSARGQH